MGECEICNNNTKVCTIDIIGVHSGAMSQVLRQAVPTWGALGERTGPHRYTYQPTPQGKEHNYFN